MSKENDSPSLEEIISDFSSHRSVVIGRLSWVAYFFNLSYLVSERSPDAQTKHGAVIVDKENRVVSTGYNGFPRGGPDLLLPNIRPKKYPYIVHAEMNALLSARCDVTGFSIFVTGFPCKSCLLHIISSGIKEIFCGTRTHQEDKESSIVRSVLCEVYGVKTYLHDEGNTSQISLCNHKKNFLPFDKL